MVTHCKSEYPVEACGILAGKNGIVKRVYEMTNIERSSISYQMESREQLRVMKEIRNIKLEMVAVYHSHPYADAYPSTRDIRLAFYEDTLYVIVSLIKTDTIVKAYEIKDSLVSEIPICI